jgi:hypothetical protein
MANKLDNAVVVIASELESCRSCSSCSIWRVVLETAEKRLVPV